MLNPEAAVLLVNLGTPDSPSFRDVYRYLIEFLTDERVIDFSWIQRQLLVRGLIVPSRFRQSAKYYQQIWTEEGSPLMVYGRRIQHGLQQLLGEKFLVELAMRYRNPSIGKTLENIQKKGVSQIIVLPLFPQYASATTGSVHQAIMKALSRFLVIPKVTFINSFCDHPSFIKAVAEIGRSHHLEGYDHILFSFHGLPERQVIKADRQHRCLQKKNCCCELTDDNRHCYSAQCYATALAISKSLQLPAASYTICFQSRLGKEPWLQPYTSDCLTQLAKAGCKRVLVFCPSFVCDCLETLYEIGVEYGHIFKQAGGEVLDLVKGLNDHPLWLEALHQITLEHL
jgi:protoporphyrin/coproporphyrin ferrochelatase